MQHLHISSQPGGIKSPRIVVTSSTQTENGYDKHVTDLQAELQRMTFTLDESVKSIVLGGMDKILQETIPTARDDSEVVDITDCQPSQSKSLISHSNKETLPDSEEVLVRKGSLRMRNQIVETSTKRTPFGMVHLKSVIRKSCNLCIQETHFILHPAPWLLWLGMKNGFSGLFSTQGWKSTLETFRAVPDGSLIFEFCKDNNVDGIKALFRRGEASKWDRNSLGQTPLHVSAPFF